MLIYYQGNLYWFTFVFKGVHMSRIEKYEGIVIGAGKTGEQSRFLDILTPDNGVVHCVARNASRSKKRFSGSLEPFTSGIFHIKGSTRYRPTLEAVDSPLSRFSISGDLTAFYFASYACRWMKTVSRDAESHCQWFHFLQGILDFLCAGKYEPAVLLWFDLSLMARSGVLGDLTSCPLCDDPLDGTRSIVCNVRDGFFAHKAHGDQSSIDVDISCYKIMSRFSSQSLLNSLKIKMSFKQWELINGFVTRLLRIHFGFCPDMREKCHDQYHWYGES